MSEPITGRVLSPSVPCPTTTCDPMRPGFDNCMSCPARPEVQADEWWESLADDRRIKIWKDKR